MILKSDKIKYLKGMCNNQCNTTTFYFNKGMLNRRENVCIVITVTCDKIRKYNTFKSKYTTIYFHEFSIIMKYAKVNHTRKKGGLQYFELFHNCQRQMLIILIYIEFCTESKK